MNIQQEFKHITRICAIQFFLLIKPNTATLPGPVCLSCDGIPRPSDCSRAIRCSPHQICSIEKIVTHDGNIWYNLGCKGSANCFSQYGHNASLINVIGRETDQRLCSQCCKTDLCNNNGCGDTGYGSLKSHACYNCPQQLSPSGCSDVTMCTSDQQCFIQRQFFGADILYTTGCLSNKVCDALGMFDISQCCSSTLCNNSYNTHSAPQTSL